MAAVMTKRGTQDNVVTYEHVCDTTADMAAINPQYINLGSICLVINGESGGLEVYIADSNKQWSMISVAAGGGGAGGLAIHICTTNEYDAVTKVPTVELPIENTIYLVPNSSTTGDLFVEWIYVDDAWEKIGSVGDLSGLVQDVQVNGTSVVQNGVANIDTDDLGIAQTVTNWLDQHVDPDTGYVIDDTLSIAGAAADAKAVGDEFADVKSALTTIEDATYNLDAVLPIDIGTYGTAFVGFTVNAAGSTDSNLSIKTNTGRAVCYFKPAEKNGKISIKSSETHSINVTVAKLVNPVIPTPGNASFGVAIDNGYTYTSNIVSETEITIQKGYTVFVDYSKSYGFVINGNIFIQLKTLSDNVIEQIDSEAESIADGLLQNYTENIYSYTGNLENGYIIDDGTDSPNYRPSKYIRTKGLVPIKRKTSNIYISKHSDAPQTLIDSLMFYFFDANEELIGAKKSVTYFTGCVFPPEGSVYFRYMTSNGGGIDSPDIDPSYVQYFDVYQLSVIGELRNKNTINWCAMGDSITQGWISFNNGGTIGSALTPQYGWVQLLAEYKNWNLTNLGIGGTGYVRGAGASAPKLVHDTNFTGYDIITIMYGVNDWKSNYNLGTPEDTPLTDAEIEASASDENVGNVCRNLKYIIEKIMSGNPTCKLIVITPINCAEFGSISTNWGIGYELSNSGSLQDMFDAIKTICEYYGIEYLDMTHSSVVNRQNIHSCLADGVHPTRKAHAQIANEICAKIGYR